MKIVVLTDNLGKAQVFTHIANAKAKLRALWLGVLGGRRGSAVLRNHDPAHAQAAKRSDFDLLLPDRNDLAGLRCGHLAERGQPQ